MSRQRQQLFTPGGGAREIEQVLLGLADGSYILSTPEGMVAECGVAVVALLGAPAETLVGRPLTETLTAGADAETRTALGELLQAGRTGRAPPVVRVVTAAGAQRSLRFVVVAVPLTLGWEFTSLLSELGSRDAGIWHTEALGLRHGRALEAIERVCVSGAQPDPGARLAGILIVVRDVDAPPLTRKDVDRRMAEQRAAARAAAVEAVRRGDEATGRPAVAAGSHAEVAELEELAERTRVLRERVEEVERESATAIAERDEARARARAAEAQAKKLWVIAADARADADAARTDGERVRAELATALDELQSARSETALTRGQLTVMRRELESADAALAGAHRELDVAHEEELAGAQAECDVLRAELATVHRDLDSVRAELTGVSGELDRTRAQLEATLAYESRAAAPSLSPADAIPPASRPAPDPDPALELPPGGPGEALALIGLDGTFKRLDDAFCSLLGCREEDLRAARWPSIIDRENVAAHEEIARALRAGEIDSASVETVYMHAQGLLVPIAGTVSMHPAGGGAATHFLFRADVSRTSGPPS
jgi:PAS domain S-box-containing protein